MSNPQATILAPVPQVGRFLTLGLVPGTDASALLTALKDVPASEGMVVGIGEPFTRALGCTLPGLRSFPSLFGPTSAFVSTQGALWLFFAGTDPGELLLRARTILARLGDGVRVDEDVLSYRYAGGRDLSGFEHGTENPRDDAAAQVAIVAGQGEGFDGSSFVATQRWLHDLSRLERMEPHVRDLVIGRNRETNEKLADATPASHIKRAAGESFDPPAFMVRRSMAWGEVRTHGLYFVAYGASLDPFERVLRRMSGLEDTIPDQVLQFSRAISGGYFWCPPIVNGQLDLRALQH